MLSKKDYILGVAFGLVCGGIAFLIISGGDSPADATLLKSGLVGLVGAGGYLYGQYNREKERQKSTQKPRSKKSIKREMRRK